MALEASNGFELSSVSPAKMIHHNGARCQWFDMSPRQSLESPDNRPPRDFCADEDNVENVAPNIEKRQPIGKEKAVTRIAKAKARPTNAGAQPAPGTSRSMVRRPGTPQSARATVGRDQVLPCMRPATPTKSRRDVDPSSPTPSLQRVGSASRLGMPTPEHSVVYDDACNTSVCFSEMSCSSRLSQLSRRSTTKRVLSSEEIIRQQTEEKKRELAKQVRRNQRNCVKARVIAENCTGRYERSTKVTMPKEFNLSVGSPRVDSSVISSDGEDSVGSARKSKVTSVKKPWRPQLGNPQLTVPRGPSFLDRTSPRRSISCPPKDEDRDDHSDFSVGCASVGSLSARAATPDKRLPVRSSTPERRSNLPTRAATPERQSGQAVRAAPSESRRGQQERAATPDGQRHRHPTPERRSAVMTSQERICYERAERARQLAVAKNDEQAAKKEHRAIFRTTTAQPDSKPQATTKVAQRRPSFGSTANRF